MLSGSLLSTAESSMCSSFDKGERVTYGIGLNRTEKHREFVGMAVAQGPTVNSTLFSELKTACAVKVEALALADPDPESHRRIEYTITHVACNAGKDFFELSATIYRE